MKPKYWIVARKEKRKIASIDLVAHDGENATLIRRYPINSFQNKDQATQKAEYDKAYFDAQGHHKTWADPL